MNYLKMKKKKRCYIKKSHTGPGGVALLIGTPFHKPKG